MTLSLVYSFNNLELDDFEENLELIDLEHDDLDLFSILCITSPSLNQLWTLWFNENTSSSISANHNSSVQLSSKSIISWLISLTNMSLN